MGPWAFGPGLRFWGSVASRGPRGRGLGLSRIRSGVWWYPGPVGPNGSDPARGLRAIQWSDRISVGRVGGCGDEARVVPTGFYPPMHGRDERRCRLQRAGGGLEAQQAVSGQCIGEGAAHARRRWPTPGGGGARQEAAPWTSGVSVPSVSKIVASLPCGGRVRPSVRWRAKVQLRQCVVHVAPSASEVVAPTEHGDAARTTSEVAAP